MWKHLFIFVLLIMTALLLCSCQSVSGVGSVAFNTNTVEGKYSYAQQQMSEGKYAEAGKLFEELGGYEESSKLSIYCKAVDAGENGQFSTAFSAFEMLGDYKDCAMMITYYQARQIEAEASQLDTYQAATYVQAAEIYDSLSFFRDSVNRAEACRDAAYKNAVELAKQKMYREAVNELLYLGNYSDSYELSLYYRAFRYLQTEDYLTASGYFRRLGEYRDAPQQAESALQQLYDIAAEKEQQGELQIASEMFYSLTDFKDAQERGAHCSYSLAEQLRNNQDWDGAVAAFQASGEYQDAATQALATRYQEGEVKRNQQDWDGAVAGFQAAGEYQDAATQALVTRYQEGEYKRSQQDWDGAVAAFLAASGYQDGAIQACATRYQEGEYKRSQLDWGGAIAAFNAAGEYQDAKTQVLATRYQYAEYMREEHNWDEAVSYFQLAGDYQDAKDQIQETRYQEGKYLRSIGDWDEAVAAFEKAGEYLDAKKWILETKYQKAADLYNKHQYFDAYDVYMSICDYANVKTILQSDKEMIEVADILEWRKKYEFGNTVFFGVYDQDGDTSNGKEPIEWYVINSDDDTALLLSKYAIDFVAFSTTVNTGVWSQSDIRKWLNNDFLALAFSSDEQKMLSALAIEDDSRNKAISYDKVFILSLSEVSSLFEYGKAYCGLTKYTRSKASQYYSVERWDGLALTTQQRSRLQTYKEYEDNYVSYWTRSTASTYDESTVVVMGSDGKPGSSVGLDSKEKSGLRPALQIIREKKNK